MTVITLNGQELYYRDSGSGPCFVIVHDGGQTSRAFDMVHSRNLSCRILTYDRRGLGRSLHHWCWEGHRHRHFPRSFTSDREDFVALVSALGYDDCTVIAFGTGVHAVPVHGSHGSIVREVIALDPPRRWPWSIVRLAGGLLASRCRRHPNGDELGVQAVTALADQLTGAVRGTPVRPDVRTAQRPTSRIATELRSQLLDEVLAACRQESR